MKRLFAVLLLCATLLPGQALSQASPPLAPETRKELSDFFSPFAAANMQGFDQKTLTDKELITSPYGIASCAPTPRLNDIFVNKQGVMVGADGKVWALSDGKALRIAVIRD